MKKLYRKGTVHPSPPLISDHLSFLPASILTLAVALSPQDREVLAYLISCSSTNCSSSGTGNRRTATATATTTNTSRGTAADHPASFNCYCFRCYMSFWVRWDSSPNRQLIHEIIDAYEDGLSMQNKKEKSRKERRKNKGSVGSGHGLVSSSDITAPVSHKEFADQSSSSRSSGVSCVDGDDGTEDEELDNGNSVRRFVSFLGEKIWGVWT